MGVQIPPVLVLIVCKTVLAGAPDQNAAFTHWENLDWATEHSMMVCRRNEIQLYDPVEGMKLSAADDPAPPLNPNFADFAQCARAGIRLSMDWDEATETRPGGCGASAAHRPSWTPGQARLLAISCLSAATAIR